MSFATIRIIVVTMLATGAAQAAGPRVHVDEATTATTHYEVEASNLEDFFVQMRAATKTSEYPGQFAWDLAYTYKYGVDQDDIRVVTVVHLEPNWTINLPEWGEASDLPPACKDIYDAAIEALSEHEDEHRVRFERALGELESAIRSLDWPSVKQFEVFMWDWKKKQMREHAAFDARTDHGTNGIVLKISPACRDID